MVFPTRKLVTKPPSEDVLTSDHNAIVITIKAQKTMTSLTGEKVVTDKVKLQALLCGLKKVGKEM